MINLYCNVMCFSLLGHQGKDQGHGGNCLWPCCLVKHQACQLNLIEWFSLTAEPHGELNRVHQLILNSAQNRTKDILTRVSNEHKDIHSSVSKVGKAIDKVSAHQNDLQN